MAVYYVNVPIYVSKGAPERARTATSLCSVEVEAKSEMDALVKFSDALNALMKRGTGPTPPPVDLMRFGDGG